MHNKEVTVYLMKQFLHILEEIFQLITLHNHLDQENKLINSKGDKYMFF